MVLLHGFMKKTQKTPKQDIDLAIKRRETASDRLVTAKCGRQIRRLSTLPALLALRSGRELIRRRGKSAQKMLFGRKGRPGSDWQQTRVAVGGLLGRKTFRTQVCRGVDRLVIPAPRHGCRLKTNWSDRTRIVSKTKVSFSRTEFSSQVAA